MPGQPAAKVEIGLVSEEIAASESDNGPGVLDEQTPPGQLGPRLLKDALVTWVDRSP